MAAGEEDVGECVDRVYTHACTIIDGLGHATWSATVPVSRSRTPSLAKLRIAHKLRRYTYCENRQTDTYTQTKYSNPRCACAPRVNKGTI